MSTPPKRPSVLLRMSPDQKDVLEREAVKHHLSMNDLLLRFIDWLGGLEPDQVFITDRPVTPPTYHPPAPAPAEAPRPLRSDRSLPKEDLRKMLMEAGMVTGFPVHMQGQTEIPMREDTTE